MSCSAYEIRQIMFTIMIKKNTWTVIERGEHFLTLLNRNSNSEKFSRWEFK